MPAARAADDPDLLEKRIKAAYLYKFAGYVDWPAAAFPEPGTPITIAVAGSDAFASEVTQAVAGRTINNRPLAVRQIQPHETPDAAHILFVAKPEQHRLAHLAKSARPQYTLLVSETEGALARGSVINFVIDENRVRFDISLDAAEKSGLRLSSRLLAVARRITKGAR